MRGPPALRCVQLEQVRKHSRVRGPLNHHLRAHAQFVPFGGALGQRQHLPPPGPHGPLNTPLQTGTASAQAKEPLRSPAFTSSLSTFLFGGAGLIQYFGDLVTLVDLFYVTQSRY